MIPQKINIKLKKQRHVKDIDCNEAQVILWGDVMFQRQIIIQNSLKYTITMGLFLLKVKNQNQNNLPCAQINRKKRNENI